MIKINYILKATFLYLSNLDVVFFSLTELIVMHCRFAFSTKQYM